MKTKFAATLILAAAVAAPAIVAHAADDLSKTKPAVVVKDSAITVKVKAKLAAEKLKSLKDIKVDTDADGVVWLTGTAGSQAEIDKAVSLTKDTAGVKSVTSNLTVKAGS